MRIMTSVTGLILLAVTAVAPATAQDKPRLIVITDIGTEPDDVESMVRLLTYSNEIEIEGLIAATSRHFVGQVRPELIAQRVDAYAKVLPNLRVHDPAYPDAALLRARIRAWRPELGMNGVGKGKDNEASRLIIETVDKADKRPVWVSIWGGAAPLAQALWSVQTSRSASEIKQFVDKLRVYSISDQDDSGPWARATFPQLFWISSIHGPGQYELAAWTGISESLPGADPAPVSRKWLRDNIQSKGALGATYPLPMFIMEGDTPSYLNLISNGLSDPEHPDWGGWGGRWEQPSPAFGLWADAADVAKGVDGKEYRTNKASIWRWRHAFQNDFAARMDWSVKPDFTAANHPPKLVVNGVAGSDTIRLAACPGDSVALDASGSSDPDGNQLTFKWWRYTDVTGRWSPPLRLTDPAAAKTSVMVERWTQPHMGDAPALYPMHHILEVTDSGTPPLTRYRRVIIEVPTDGRAINGKPCPKVAMSPEPPQGDFMATAKVSGQAWSVSDTSIEALIGNPLAKAALQSYFPEIVSAAETHGAVRNMTVEALAPLIAGVTVEKIKALEADLAKMPGSPPER